MKWNLRPHATIIFLTLVILVATTIVINQGPARAQGELSYRQYREMSWVTDRLNHMAQFEPLDGESGMYFALAERFGTVQIYKRDATGVRRVWKSIYLSGVPEELLVADLDGDGFDDSLLCRTTGAKVYVWSLDGYDLVWESLAGEFQKISGYTVANVDDSPESEILLLADNKITYIDGRSFNRKYTTINEFNASAIRCGDVDGDGRNEIVLNSGQIVDSVTGEIEWEEQTFYNRIELLDITGDGIPDVLTENEVGGGMKVFNIAYRSEIRFQ